MYKKGTGNDKQGKDAENRTLCPYRNFSQAITLDNKYNAQNLIKSQFDITTLESLHKIFGVYGDFVAV